MALDFLGIKSALQALVDEKRRIVRELESLKQKREDVMMLPLPKEDVVRKVSDHVDRMVARYRKEISESIMGIAGTPLESEIRENHGIVRPAQMRGEMLPDYSLFALIGPERIKKAITETVNAMGWPKAGIPFNQRQKEIERLDNEITSLEEKLRTMMNEAEKAGVRV